MKIALPFFLFSSLAFAGIVQFDVTHPRQYRFAWTDVCLEWGISQAQVIPALLESPDASTLNCMGRRIELSEFCEKKWGKRGDYMRAFSDSVSRDVICELGDRAVLQYRCDGQSPSVYCGKSAVSCEALRFRLASHHVLTYHYRSSESSVLHCVFESKEAVDRILPSIW